MGRRLSGRWTAINRPPCDEESRQGEAPFRAEDDAPSSARTEPRPTRSLAYPEPRPTRSLALPGASPYPELRPTWRAAYLESRHMAYFTAPNVNPCTSCFCVSQPSTMIGATASRDAA